MNTLRQLKHQSLRCTENLNFPEDTTLHWISQNAHAVVFLNCYDQSFETAYVHLSRAAAAVYPALQAHFDVPIGQAAARFGSYVVSQVTLALQSSSKRGFLKLNKILMNLP